MAKTYRIDLVLNNSQAEAATRRSVAGLAQIEKAAEKTAATRERMAAREAAAYDRNALRAQRAADRAADAAVKAGERAAAATTRTAEREARQKQLIGDRMVARESGRMVTSERAAQRAADAAVKAKEREARQKQLIDNRMGARENARLVASERANQRVADSAIRVKEREARQKQAIEDRMIGREHKRMVAKAKREGPGTLGSDITDFAGKAAGLGAVAGIVLKSFVDTNNAILESSHLVTDYREKLLELAALKGHLGNTTTELKEQVLFRAKTGQTKEAAIALTSQALNVGQISLDSLDPKGRKGVMSPAEFTKAQVLAGRFQASVGADPTAIGGLVGNIPAFSGKGRMTGEENYQRLRQYEKIMQLGGFSMSSGAEQAGKLAPYITSKMIGDLPAMSLMALMSNSVPEKGATGFEHLMRATVGGVGRLRGAAMEGTDVVKTGPYLTSLGIKPDTDPTDMLRRISDDMAAHEGKPGYNAMNYLGTKGYGNMHDREALMLFHGKRKEFEEMYAPLTDEAKLPSIEKATADVKHAMRTDPALLQQQAVNAGDVSNIVEDQGGMVASYDAINRATFEQMRGEKNSIVRGMKYENLSSMNPFNIIANAAVNQRMMTNVNAKLAKAGLPAYEGQPGFGDLNYGARARDFGILSANLRNRDIDIMPDQVEMAGKATAELDKQANLASALERNAAVTEANTAAMRRELGGGSGDGGTSRALPESSAPRAGAMR